MWIKVLKDKVSMESTPYQAVPFKAPEGSEIMGRVVKSYFDNLESDMFLPVLERHNLRPNEMSDDQWYPLQVYYDIDKEIYKGVNGASALVAIGKATMANLLSRTTYTTLEDYLVNGLGTIAGRSFIRNVPDSFGFVVTKIGNKHFHIKSNMPSANESIYGSLWEACRLLKGEKETFRINPIIGYPGNDISATFEVTWE